MGLEFGLDEYRAIDSFSHEIGIVWSASAWDIESQLFLRQFQVPFNKVASAMITHREFLEVVAVERKITYVSTGMCEIEDIERAVEIFRTSECPIVLMHTTSTYPAAERELNLSLIPYLASRFGLPVGYSGHESSVSPSIVAAALGAVAIERHITLDRSMYGSDQAASLEERGLRELVSVVRKIPVILGKPQKSFLESEMPVAEKLRYWL
jgi:N-acetylneuraminate synthase